VTWGSGTFVPPEAEREIFVVFCFTPQNGSLWRYCDVLSPGEFTRQLRGDTVELTILTPGAEKRVSQFDFCYFSRTHRISQKVILRKI
jgi:hypothetical protein